MDYILANQLSRADALARRQSESERHALLLRRRLINTTFPLSRDQQGRLLTLPFPKIIRPTITSEPFEKLQKILPSKEFEEMSFEDRRGEVSDVVVGFTILN